MKHIRIILAAALLFSSEARADFTFTAGSGLTAFSFTSTTGGTSLCAAASTHCFASVPIDSAGAQLFATGNAGFVRFPSAQTVTANAGTGFAGLGAVSNAASATTFLNGLAVGQYLASPPTLTANNYQQFLLDVNGNLKVNIAGGLNGNGQNTMVNSAPVAIASNQSPIPVSRDTTSNSATHGLYSNLLQGDAVLASTNPLPVLHVGTGYETVAASQTAQVMGGSGATGDYLSHCVVYPTSTSPGVVTVFDNTSAAGANVVAFPGGSSSLSNLVPFSFPVGAISTAGPWKVTTGANLVVTCYGRFT